MWKCLPIQNHNTTNIDVCLQTKPIAPPSEVLFAVPVKHVVVHPETEQRVRGKSGRKGRQILHKGRNVVPIVRPAKGHTHTDAANRSGDRTDEPRQCVQQPSDTG